MDNGMEMAVALRGVPVAGRAVLRRLRDAVGALLGAVLRAANPGDAGASRGAGWAARARALLLRALLPLLAFGAALRYLARKRAFFRKVVGPRLDKERLRA